MTDDSAVNPNHQTRRVFTDVDERSGWTVYHHNECGKEWSEPSDDCLPNHCPGCGVKIFNEQR